MTDLMWASVVALSDVDTPVAWTPVARPTPGPEDVLIEVVAAGLDRVDTYLRRGTHGMAVRRPTILGRDVAGVVVACGDQVPNLHPGDAVLGLGRGTHAEYTLAHWAHCVPKPADWSFVEAAALPTPGRTAWDALAHRAGLRSGERVLVVAAGGAVGSAALQLARAAGAEVYATAGSAAKCARAEAHGALGSVEHSGDDLADRLRRLSDGFDVIVDPLGGTVWPQLLDVLRPYGRVVTCGVAAGARAPVHLGRLMTMGWQLIGIGRPDQRRIGEHLHECLDAMVTNGLRPIIDRTFPLPEAPAAHRLMEESAFFGRIVLTA